MEQWSSELIIGFYHTLDTDTMVCYAIGIYTLTYNSINFKSGSVTVAILNKKTGQKVME